MLDRKKVSMVMSKIQQKEERKTATPFAATQRK
jgi:hypothetical protein